MDADPKHDGFPLGLRYFIIKSYNHRNIATSIDKGKWATNSKANESKLDMAYKHSNAVILVFSVNGSGCFQVCRDWYRLEKKCQSFLSLCLSCLAYHVLLLIRMLPLTGSARNCTRLCN